MNCSNNSYELLKGVYEGLTELKELFIETKYKSKIDDIQDKLGDLPIWIMKDLEDCEVSLIEILKYKVVNREAKAGDLICITKGGQVLGIDYIDKYYKVYERNLSPGNIKTTYLLARDNLSKEKHTYKIPLSENQYIILEKIKEINKI